MNIWSTGPPYASPQLSKRLADTREDGADEGKVDEEEKKKKKKKKIRLSSPLQSDQWENR